MVINVTFMREDTCIDAFYTGSGKNLINRYSAVSESGGYVYFHTLKALLS